jgi:hypothetical protein
MSSRTGKRSQHTLFWTTRPLGQIAPWIRAAARTFINLCAAGLSKDIDKPLAAEVKERNAARNSKDLICKAQKSKECADRGSSLARHELTRVGFVFQQGKGTGTDSAKKEWVGERYLY